jgi:hypothetical protein
MFFETAYYLGRMTKVGADEETEPDRQQVITNVFYESFVLHFRNLAEFLCSERPRPDDVVAIDFVPDPTKWAAPATSQAFKDARVRIPLKSPPIPKQTGTHCGANRQSEKSERSDAGNFVHSLRVV